MESAEYYLNEIEQARKQLEYNALEMDALLNSRRALENVISEAEWHLRELPENICNQCARKAECKPLFAAECELFAES